jgi:hypothetical protein
MRTICSSMGGIQCLSSTQRCARRINSFPNSPANNHRPFILLISCSTLTTRHNLLLPSLRRAFALLHIKRSITLDIDQPSASIATDAAVDEMLYNELEEMKKLLSTTRSNIPRYQRFCMRKRVWECMTRTRGIDGGRRLPRVLRNLALVLGESSATINGRVGAVVGRES